MLCDPPSHVKQPRTTTRGINSRERESVSVNSSNVTVVSDKVEVVSNVNAVTGATTHALLQIIRVPAEGQTGVSPAVVLFDTGSDKTYVSSSLVKRIDPEWVGSQNMAFAAFGSGKSSRIEQRNIYRVSLQGPEGKGGNIIAAEIPIICAPLTRPVVPQHVLESFGEGCDVSECV